MTERVTVFFKENKCIPIPKIERVPKLRSMRNVWVVCFPIPKIERVPKPKVSKPSSSTSFPIPKIERVPKHGP